jgi:hypothetical protein
LSVAPVQTKFSVLPIIDLRKQINVPMEQMVTYNVHNTFNPGNDMGPWSGFASSVNTESVLRNQIYALQKCSQSVYVPSSKSDLYNVNFESKGVNQPYPELFNTYAPVQNQRDTVDDKMNKMGAGLFNNSTRMQREDTD